MTQLFDTTLAIDPGRVRLENSLKGAAAIVTAILATSLIIYTFMTPPSPQPIAYSMLIAFLGSMIIRDPIAADRKKTMLLSAVLFAVAPFIVGEVRTNNLIDIVILLVLMFLSFYLRRYGLRVAELALCALFAFYFANLFGATLQTAVWFAVGGLLGVAATYFWTFVIRPYDPAAYARRALEAYSKLLEEEVRLVAQALESPDNWDSAQTGMRRIQRARRIIEQQLAGVITLPGWTRDLVAGLRVQLLDAEQGLQNLSDGAAAIARNGGQAPAGLLSALRDTVGALQAHVAAGTTASAEILHSATARLTTEAAKLQGEAATFSMAAMEVGGGGLRLADAGRDLRGFKLATDAPIVVPAHPPAAHPAASSSGKFWERLQPTTIFGLQAVVATSLAVLAAVLLNLDHPYWAFWTAYIVVAGPAGESLRKIFFRVAGTVVGAIIGTLLALALPAEPLIILPLGILCLFMVLYTGVINYALTVFWITVFVALSYGLKGELPSVILVDRTLSTVIGALITAAVVTLILPVREENRYRAALKQFLTAIDHYLDSIVDSLDSPTQPQELDAAMVQAVDTYEAIEQTLPALSAEFGPFSAARSRSAEYGASFRLLRTNVDSFAESSSGVAIGPNQKSAILRGWETVHQNIESIMATLGGKPSASMQAWPIADGVATEVTGVNSSAGSNTSSDTSGNRPLVYLYRINEQLMALGKEVRMARVQ